MSDMIYTELINGMTWSYSRIKCFKECRYRWFLKYISHIKESPMFYSSYGKFMHKLIERYYKGELTKNEMKNEFLLNYKTEVRGLRPRASTVQKFIDASIGYLDSFEPFPYKTVSVEEKMEFNIDGIPFIGFIDYLGEKDGEYYIIDNKSRALKPRSKRAKPTRKDKELDEMLVQLYLYAAAVKQKYGKFPKALCFNCFRNGVFIEEPFVMEKYQQAIQWAKDSIQEIKDCPRFSPWKNYFACNYICGVNNDCLYWLEGGIE